MNAVPRFNRDRPKAGRWHVKPEAGRWVVITPQGHPLPFDSLAVALDYAHNRVQLARRLRQLATTSTEARERARARLLG